MKKSSGNQRSSTAKEDGLDRRTLLLSGGGLGIAGLVAGETIVAAQQTSSPLPSSMHSPGAGFRAYGTPDMREASVQRLIFTRDGNPVSGASLTPLERLEGRITPSGLHYERHHNGVPAVDPATHRLIIHGLVDKALSWSLADLRRYPMESHAYFLECAGNSALNIAPVPKQVSAGNLHGLFSLSEWTGVRLSLLLEEAGASSDARWVIAESADGASYSRSVPIDKCRTDALIGLYQNGEALRPEQGYPMRLILPGYEGSTQIKWLHRLKITSEPAHSREETARYSSFLANGKAGQFDFTMGVKSVILKPSFGYTLDQPGIYEISGLAWSGDGRITGVDISVDGASSWQPAALEGEATPMAAVRFRLPWQWDGKPATIMSRAKDDSGAIQPNRAEWMARYKPDQIYHNNMMQAWSIAADGQVSNMYV